MIHFRALSKFRVTMFKWWISSGRSNLARRMCQYACLPAPNTVISCTDCRFFSSMVDASAVRKAVTSSALMRPVVLPRLSNSVSEPLIVDTGGMESGSVVMEVPVVLPTELPVSNEEDEDPGLSALLTVDMEFLELAEAPLELTLESTDICSTRLGRPEASGGTIFTTFMPWPVILLAGMNNVVEPSFRFRCVRSGWKSEQQSFASFDVEYQCRASASFSCMTRMSSLLKEWRMRLTSRSPKTVSGISLNVLDDL